MTWPSSLDFAQLRQRPRWIAAFLISALLSGVMPLVHQAVFGPDRISAALTEMLESDFLHRRADEAMRERIHELVANRPVVGPVVVTAAVSALVVALSAVVLNMTSLVLGAEVTAGQALAVASVAALAEILLRTMFFGVVVIAMGTERSVALDWTHVAPSNLAFLDGLNATAVWASFVSSVDVFTIAGIAVSSIGLRVMDATLSPGRAVLSSSAWPTMCLMARVLIAALFGVPMR